MGVIYPNKSTWLDYAPRFSKACNSLDASTDEAEGILTGSGTNMKRRRSLSWSDISNVFCLLVKR